MIIIGFVLSLIGGAMIETPIIGYMHGENGLLALICGILFGALFLGPGIAAIVYGAKEAIKTRWEGPLKDVKEALLPGFKEAKAESFLDRKLVDFRKHYSEFFGKSRTLENESIQKDVTQIYRNILQLQKNRLTRLGLTCEMLIRRMAYTKEDGIKRNDYADGKYSIMDITEEVAAKTIYKKDGKEIYTKVDKETANYTIIHARTIGEKEIICPNCGVETTREALLDGCDYCGTKFTVEDLNSRIAMFAFRPDMKLRYEKYERTRNRVILIAVIAAILAVFLGFTVYAVITAPELLEKAEGGILLTLLASIFAIVIASPVYILSFLIVYAGVILPVVAVLAAISFFISKKVKAIKKRPMLARGQEEQIRKWDPNFSIAGFYSNVQNKLSSVIYAENEAQIQTFAYGDLTGLLGRFSDVVAVDVDRLELAAFSAGDKLQRAEVDAFLYLTRYNGKRCRVKKEKMTIALLKDAACKTQVVCAPAITRCRGCGASLDFLQGRKCAYCGREVDLIRYDWVIQNIIY